MCDMDELKLKEISSLFGAPAKEVKDLCEKELQEFNGRFRNLKPREKEQALIESIDRLIKGFATKSGSDRLPDWELGWSENLKKLSEDSNDLDNLVPGYVRPGQIMRLNGEYAIFEDAEIENRYIALFRSWLSQKFLVQYDNEKHLSF